MKQSKNAAVDAIFREMMIKSVDIVDLCKRWGGKFVPEEEAEVIQPLPFDILYQSGDIYSYKILDEKPIAILVERCFISLWDLPEKQSFLDAIQKTEKIKFLGRPANMGVRKIWDFLFENAEVVNQEIESLGGQKIDFSSAYWIYSHSGRSVSLCIENGAKQVVSKSKELNVRPMCMLP